jgi:hypothetical protein
MERFVDKLTEKLDRELVKINPESNAVKGYDLCVKLVGDCIEEMKSYLATHPFKDVAAEVNYFKHTAPIFYHRYFYFTKLYNAALSCITSTKEVYANFIEKEEKAVEEFFIRYGEFCRYYYMGITSLDEQFFTRGVPANWILDEVAVLIDSNFSLGTYRLSWIKANEEYRRFLETEKMRLENRQPVTGVQWQGRTYSWEATDSDATELIYAFSRKKPVKVNGREADIKDYAIMFKDFFQKEIKNVYRTRVYNKRRKKDIAPFLSSLLQAVIGTG